jgi:hypothetical protein
MDKPWQWQTLFNNNDNLTCEFFLDYHNVDGDDSTIEWHFLFSNKLLTFEFLQERILKRHSEDISVFIYDDLYDNEFTIDREKFLWEYRRREFMKIGGIFNEIVMLVCKPPPLDSLNYDDQMDAFIAKMYNLGFEAFL